MKVRFLQIIWSDLKLAIDEMKRTLIVSNCDLTSFKIFKNLFAEICYHRWILYWILLRDKNKTVYIPLLTLKNWINRKTVIFSTMYLSMLAGFSNCYTRTLLLELWNWLHTICIKYNTISVLLFKRNDIIDESSHP